MRLACLALLFAAACGGRAQTQTLPPAPTVPNEEIGTGGPAVTPETPDDDGLAAKDPRIVDLDIIRVRGEGTGTGSEPAGSTVATADLFKAAHEALKAGRSKEAIGRFQQLIDEFPDSLYAPISLFNIAAIYDGQGDTNQTISTLRELVTKYPDARESIEGHMYIAALYAEHRNWVEAEKTLSEVVVRKGLTAADRVEANARLGYVKLEQTQFDAADAAIEAAIAEWRRAPHIDEPYYIAMAFYYRGEILHRKFTALTPALPDDTLMKAMEAKRTLAVAAYDRWKEALGFRHAYWATAAGFRMSEIYVELWDATVKAPLPTQLPADKRKLYLSQVHDNMHDHLVKALDGHQMNIELAKAFGVDTEWSKASEVRAVQVMELLAQEAKRPRE